MNCVCFWCGQEFYDPRFEGMKNITGICDRCKEKRFA